MVETNTTAGPASALRSLLRGALVLDGAIFLASAMFNFGIRVPLGFTTLGFPSPVLPAALGEVAIAAGLIAAARTGRPAHALLASVAAAAGIAFGLLSARVVGPARDIHVLLVPVTAFVFVVLLATFVMRSRSRASGGEVTRGGALATPAPERRAVAVAALMTIAAAAYALASAVHFGLVISLGPVALRDPFDGAAVPEALIAVVLLGGAVAVARRADGAWLGALLATAFSGLLTLFGLTITVRASRPGDVAYHVSVLLLVAAILALLLLPATRRALASVSAEVVEGEGRTV